MTDQFTWLLVVCGHPAAGKTTLGRRLAADLRLPFLAKDDIKELLFESLGWRRKDWSSRLGSATYSLLYHFAAVELEVEHSVMVESNFNHDVGAREIHALRERFGCNLLQIHCWADKATLLERYEQRVRTKERHPGHLDAEFVREYAQRLDREPNEPLSLDGETIVVDTSDFAAIAYDRILVQVRTITGRNITR